MTSSSLPSQLIVEDKYVVTQNIREASIVIQNTSEPPLTLTINLTSPLVREEIEKAAAGGKRCHLDLVGSDRPPTPTPRREAQ